MDAWLTASPFWGAGIYIGGSMASCQPTAVDPGQPHLDATWVARQRANGWRYAAQTTNPPQGYVDVVSRWLVITRAAVLPMTLVAGLLAGLLLIDEPARALVAFAVAFVALAAVSAYTSRWMRAARPGDAAPDARVEPPTQTVRRTAVALALALVVTARSDEPADRLTDVVFTLPEGFPAVSASSLTLAPAGGSVTAGDLAWVASGSGTPT